MKIHAMIAGLLAASATLAGCSDAEVSSEPLTNEQAVPKILEQTVGKTPTDMLQTIAGNFYGTFEIAKSLGGQPGESWDEARFNAELETAFAPLSDQIDAAFAKQVASQMAEGEGQGLLDTLAEGKNTEYALCAFSSDDAEEGNRLESCGERLGMEPSQALQDALGTVASQMANTIQRDETLSVAIGYATCSVFAKFSGEVSTDALTVNLGDTQIGIGPDKRPCTEFDALAAATFTGEITPNYPDSE